MSVFVPTGATVAVDPLDVLLVAPNGSTSTTLYLAQGQPVVVAALPAAVVAELNTAAGLVGPDTLFTTPVAASEWPSPVYIAGAQVKRVQPSGATNLGSMVLFALSGFMVTVPAVDLTAMMALINATTTGGGGGGGSGGAGIFWTPEPTSEQATNLLLLSSAASYAPWPEEAGNVVTVAVALSGLTTEAGTIDVAVKLPEGYEGSQLTPAVATGDVGDGNTVAVPCAILGDTLSFTFDATLSAEFVVWCTAHYQSQI
jgi:hypothetical protein